MPDPTAPAPPPPPVEPPRTFEPSRPPERTAPPPPPAELPRTFEPSRPSETTPPPSPRAPEPPRPFEPSRPPEPTSPPPPRPTEPSRTFEPSRPPQQAPAPPPTAPRPQEPAEARWEDVVDPDPVPAQTAEPVRRAPEPESWPEPRPARRAPAPPAPGPTARSTQPAATNGDEYDDEEEYDEVETVSRWISLLATVGTALIGIVSIQVIASIVEGLSLKKGERVGIPDDILHRLGYPFGGLGATALVFLVLGVVLMAMPSVLDELLPATQDRVVGVALVVAIVMGVIIALGSLLAVRANLHEYAAKGVAVPSYVRVQFTNFLLGALGAAALALFGSIVVMQERARERVD